MKTKTNEPLEGSQRGNMERNNRCVLEADAEPVGMIPTWNQQQTTVQMPYVQLKGGKVRRPVEAEVENEFSTSSTNRRGAGGRGSIARYGVEYVRVMDRHYAPLTKEALVRRYKRMGRDAEFLYKQGIIDNLSPKSMTKEDVHNYLTYRMNLGVSNSEMDHEIAAMKSLFEFCENGAVKAALTHYPGLRPTKRTDRLPSLTDEQVARILELAESQDDSDWHAMKAYAIPVWALATGMRSKELLLCDIDHVNTNGQVWTAMVMHPKGEGTYGKPRSTVIDPQMVPFIVRYLNARQRYVSDRGMTIRALFPGGASEGGYMQGNTARNLKKKVEADVGFDFDLRICRRTFGQRLLNRGVSIEQVSKIMGHKNTVTTENCYCSMGNASAVNQVAYMLGGNNPFASGFGTPFGQVPPMDYFGYEFRNGLR